MERHILSSYQSLSLSIPGGSQRVLSTVHETNATSHIINRIVTILLNKDSIVVQLMMLFLRVKYITLIKMIYEPKSSSYLTMIWLTTRPASQRRCNILHPKKQEILSLQIFRFGYRCSNFNHDHLAPIK